MQQPSPQQLETASVFFVDRMKLTFQGPYKVDPDHAAAEYSDFLARYSAAVLAKAWDKCRSEHIGPRWPTIAECRGFCEAAAKEIEYSAPRPESTDRKASFGRQVNSELTIMANRTANHSDLETWAQQFPKPSTARMHVAFEVERTAREFVINSLRSGRTIPDRWTLAEKDWLSIEARIRCQNEVFERNARLASRVKSLGNSVQTISEKAA